MVYHGHIEYFAVYNMPVQYRTFYARKLVNIKEKEESSMNKASGKHDAQPTRVVKGPAINQR